MSSAKLSKSIMIKKITTILLSCSLVFGSVSFAFAAPTTADQYAQYSGSGWSYNSSSHNFIANNQLSNSVPYVILSYLRDMYSQLSFDNSGYGYSYSNNTMRGIDITGSGKSSGGLYNIGKLIGLLNTNLMSQFVFTTNVNEVPLYSWKQFTDTNLYHWDFSNGDFIDNFVNGIASVNNNIAYIANQLYSDSSNNRSLLNQAFHKIVDTTFVDYTTILNNIKTNTDNLSGIKTDTSNLSGIKTDTSNLSGIKIDTGISSEQLITQTSIISSHTPLISNISNNTDNIYGLLNNYPISTFVVRRPWVGSSSGELTNITSRMFASSYKYSSEPGTFRFHIANGGTSVFDVMSINLAYLLSQIFTVDGSYFARRYDVNNNSLINVRNGNDFVFSSSIADFLWRFDETLVLPLNKLQYLLADDNSINAKKNNSSQESAILNGFTGSGDASASASDFGIVKDSVLSVKSGVDTNVSASEALNIFNNSDGYGFWSTDCLNALDTTNSNRVLRSRNGSDTPLYDEKLQALYNAMGVNND